MGCRFGWLWTEFSTWPPLLQPPMPYNFCWLNHINRIWKMTRPRCRPPRLSPIFLLAIRRYQSYYFSHIRKKSQKQRYNNTHMVQPWLPRPANTSTTVEPRKNNNKLSFVGVRCSSCKQIQKKTQKKLARGERNKGLEDLKIGHFFSHPVFSLTYHLLKK